MVKKLIVTVLGIFVFSNGWCVQNANQQLDEKLISHDRILVKFKSNISGKTLQSLHAPIQATVVRSYSQLKGLHAIQVAKGTSVQKSLQYYRSLPGVEYAEPDYIVKPLLTPNDVKFGDLWNMHNTGQTGGTVDADINAPEAWDVSTGNNNVFVAVIDSGIDYTHPDIQPNMWINPGEIPNNGIDDDGNGYIDDVHGIETITDSGDPMDDNGHGTHVSGTVAGVGNNFHGVAGVGWKTRLVGCKFIYSVGFGTSSDAIQCIDYIVSLKTRSVNPVNIVVANNSWGGGGYSQAMYDAILAAQNAGILFVAAAGNSAADNNGADHYPSNFNLASVISVAATDHDDLLANFSNLGSSSVHVGAPGKSIYSTVPFGTCELCDSTGYVTLSGTSMAAPHVSGLIALTSAVMPTVSMYKIKNLVIAGGTPVTSLTATTISGRRIRAWDVNGTGSMSCNNQQVYKRTSPTTDVVFGDVGSPFVMSAININCGDSSGPIDVADIVSGSTITLQDDGIGIDQVISDGIVTSQYTPTQSTVLNFPNNDSVKVYIPNDYTLDASVAYNYRTISGTPLNMSDDTEVKLAIPFPIKFGDIQNSSSDVYISNNGVIRIDGIGVGYQNETLPYGGVNTIIAPFWDDLDGRGVGDVYWEVQGTQPNRELIIEWRDMLPYPYDNYSDGITFQVVLFESRSDILFNYKDVIFGDIALDNGKSATVGVQVSKNRGLQISYNAAVITNNSSLLFKTNYVGPIAYAGPNKRVNYGKTIDLDGTGSSFINGSITSYQWSQLSGTPVTLQGANTATPTFTAPSQAGALMFELTVTASDATTAKDFVEIDINTPPLSNAGSDQSVMVRETVFLSGRGVDTDGQIASYSWRQLSGAGVTLTDSDTMNPSFDAPIHQTNVTLELTVTDNDGGTSSDTIDVVVTAPSTPTPSNSNTTSSSSGSSGGCSVSQGTPYDPIWLGLIAFLILIRQTARCGKYNNQAN